MRRTTSVLAAALTAALLLPGATPATAAPGACNPGPVELAGGGDTTLVASQEHVQGYVLRRRLGAGRSCVVPGATVQLLARDAGTTTTRVVRTGTTDADGRVQFRVHPPFTVVLTGRSLPGGGFAAVDSTRSVLSIATRLTIARRALDRCRVEVRGRTYPAKPGTPVEVWRERPGDGAVRVARLIVRADGTYLGTVAIPCGSSERMFATIQRTARNDDGSSDRPGHVATRAVTCGEAQPAEGEVATALTHAFEPFNTTTPVGGGWWGEQVITNRTDRTLVFDSYSSETYSLLRRGTTVRIGSNTFNDAVAVTPRELAPGAELRERVRLVAANCDAPVPPGTVVLATSPGPSFPAGAVLVGQTVLSTNKGRSVSDRRALTVS